MFFFQILISNGDSSTLAGNPGLYLTKHMWTPYYREGKGGAGVAGGSYIYVWMEVLGDRVCVGDGYVLTELGTFVWSIVYFFYLQIHVGTFRYNCSFYSLVLTIYTRYNHHGMSER